MQLVVNAYNVIGSPPPMRGKGRLKERDFTLQGITPAYAGKSEIVPRFKHAIEDHPRLCGEKMTEHFQNQFLIGSPPPMRGKVTQNKYRNSHVGITPAYAGKSFA